MRCRPLFPSGSVARFPPVSRSALPTGTGLPTLDRFRRAVGSPFQACVEDGCLLELTLVEVVDAGRRPGWESFSLLFLGRAPLLPQATYRVQHAELGSFPLFLVPIQREGDGHCYEAVFNRPGS